MCDHGDTAPVRVKIAADLSFSGEEYWKDAQIDRCIAPLVEALQRAGIDMRSSCCGHGKAKANVVLADGAVMEFVPPDRHLENVLRSIPDGSGV